MPTKKSIETESSTNLSTTSSKFKKINGSTRMPRAAEKHLKNMEEQKKQNQIQKEEADQAVATDVTPKIVVKPPIIRSNIKGDKQIASKIVKTVVTIED